MAPEQKKKKRNGNRSKASTEKHKAQWLARIAMKKAAVKAEKLKKASSNTSKMFEYHY